MLFQRLLLPALLAVTTATALPEQAEALSVGDLTTVGSSQLTIGTLTGEFIEGDPVFGIPNEFFAGTDAGPVTADFIDAAGTGPVTVAGLEFFADFLDFGSPDGPDGTFEVSSTSDILLSGIFTAEVFSAGVLTAAAMLDPSAVSSDIGTAFSGGFAILQFTGIDGTPDTGSVTIFGAAPTATIPLPGGLLLLLTGLAGVGLVARRRSSVPSIA